MSKLAKALTAAAGNAGGAGLMVEDVFSTYLYEGNSSIQTITNSIDLDGEGGLVWLKRRDNPGYGVDHVLMDNERGVSKILYSNLTDAETTTSWSTSFNSDGFNFTTASGYVNGSGGDYASWTFRKAEKFFDVVTYTGTGSAQTIAHNLGSVPACIIIKSTNLARDWAVYHTSTGNGQALTLNNTTAARSFAGWNYTTPTDTEFYLGVDSDVNNVSGTYVAYLFASDAGGFGDDDESIIKCGSYVGTGASGNTVDFGFEPQWVLIKNTQVGTKSWHISDMMRGLNYSTDRTLSPNTSSAEANWAVVKPTATGLLFTDGDDNFNSAHTFIYIAIRRPMKTPESGTEVFSPVSYTGNNAARTITAGFPIDAEINFVRSSAAGHPFVSRLTGGRDLTTDTTDSEGTLYSSFLGFDNQLGLEFKDATGYSYYNSSANTYVGYMFKRATGFFDVVAYTGTGANPRSVTHNLKVPPELLILKSRQNARTWRVSCPTVTGTTQALILNSTTGVFSSTEFPSLPTETTFTINSDPNINANGENYIAYLFATVAGVSKVFSVTKSSGSDATVDCGFSAGPRFVMLKRTDSTGDWYVWDSVRGIVSGNDPYLLLNSTAAEVTTTDYIDPLASGFTIVDGGLANGDYIGLAIA